MLHFYLYYIFCPFSSINLNKNSTIKIHYARAELLVRGPIAVGDFPRDLSDPSNRPNYSRFIFVYRIQSNNNLVIWSDSSNILAMAGTVNYARPFRASRRRQFPWYNPLSSVDFVHSRSVMSNSKRQDENGDEKGQASPRQL